MAISKELKYHLYSTEGSLKDRKEIKLQINKTKGIYIIHRALVQQMHEKRKGSAHSKNRNEVSGGGKKPWKQKGTGRARAGSIRSPLWRGGGVIFGPKAKKYVKKINRKEKQIALNTLLYSKLKNTIVVDKFNLKIKQPKTKVIIQKIKQLNINTYNTILIILSEKNTILDLCARNLRNVQIRTFNQINTLRILRADTLIIESKALDQIEKICSN